METDCPHGRRPGPQERCYRLDLTSVERVTGGSSKRGDMAKKKARGSGRGTAKGRVEPRPPWESTWKRASKVSSSIWWEVDDGSDPPTHEEVFKVLDQLASADDGLDSLAALAAVLDVTDGVCDVSSQLRAVAERTVDPSEARLFNGYVSPESAPQADASAMAGRMLRAHRDRDLDAMVEAANLNPRLFVERQFVGVLTIAPVLAYEISRYSTATPVSERVSEFFDVCPIPMAGAEDLLDYLVWGMLGRRRMVMGDEESLSGKDAEILISLGEKVLENRPVVDRFLQWALRVAAEVRRTRPSKSVDQCGATLTSHFGPKVGELAVRVSEDPATRRFRRVDVPTGSSYGDWLRWLELVSPKGFRHRTLGSFTPEDLVMAKETVELRGEVIRLVNRLQSSGGPAVWSSGALFWSLARRQEWLVDLSGMLVGESTASEVFLKYADDFPTGVALGPAGPSVAAQELFLWLAGDLAIRDLVADGDIDVLEGLSLEDREAALIEKGEVLAARVEEAVSLGDPAADELRGLEGWVGEIAEKAATGIRRPASDFEPFTVGDDFGRWIAQLGGWLKARGWRPPKERPEIEEIPEIEPPPPCDPDLAIGSGDEVVEVLEPDAPIVIVYVGGNEKQAKIQMSVNEHVQYCYGSLVTVEWVHIDWGANWPKDADRVDGFLDAGADAVVLLKLVRTGMGTRVRRSCGEHEVPWVSCQTGGQTSSMRAIDEAVQVVCRLRLDA